MGPREGAGETGHGQWSCPEQPEARPPKWETGAKTLGVGPRKSSAAGHGRTQERAPGVPGLDGTRLSPEGMKARSQVTEGRAGASHESGDGPAVGLVERG